MRILVTNYGSSSLEYWSIGMEDESVLTKGLYEKTSIEGSKLTHEAEGKGKHVVEDPVPNYLTAIKTAMNALAGPVYDVIKDTGEIPAVRHRVFHAGTAYNDSVIANDDVKRAIRGCFDPGPLHNPTNLISIEACEEIIPGAPNVAVSDTTFGMFMPEKTCLYTISHEYFEEYNIRRYGFHGTSHRFVSDEAIKFSNLDPEKAGVIVCHLSNGVSVSAPIGGRCVGTGMGLTLLESLIMGTRSGDIDPVVAQFVCNKEGKIVNEVPDILNKKSGIFSMSGGISSNLCDIENAKAEGNHLAVVMLDAFQYHVVKYIGAYVAATNGMDAVVFITDVDENDKPRRKATCESLGYLGAKIDGEVNDVRSQKRIISTPDPKVKVVLIPTNKELAITRETLALVK